MIKPHKKYPRWTILEITTPRAIYHIKLNKSDSDGTIYGKYILKFSIFKGEKIKNTNPVLMPEGCFTNKSIIKLKKLPLVDLK